MSNTYTIQNGELYHYGVKGQKWGRRRYQNPDGSLTPAGIKRYAKKSYAKSSYESNTSVSGKVYDKFTGAHKIIADVKYEQSSARKNKEAAEQYLAEKQAKRDRPTKQKVQSAASKGAKKAAEIVAKAGNAYVSDQLFFGGTGTKIAKEAITTAGRATVTAYTMARGGYDIKWYDKNGRRVG